MVRVVENDIARLLHELSPGVGATRQAPGVGATRQAAWRRCLDEDRRVWLWNFSWGLDRPVPRKGDRPQATAIEAFILSDPSLFVRVGKEPGVGSEMGGDPLRPIAAVLGWPSDRLASAVMEAIGRWATPAETARLGFDLAWPGSLAVHDRFKLSPFEPKSVEAADDWTPERLRANSGYQDDPDFFEALIEGSARDPAEVRRLAAEGLKDRETAFPWRDLWTPSRTQPAGHSFIAVAARDLFGFAPPAEDEPVTIRARRLPFHPDVDLIDMVDRRAGYPRIARFLAEYKEDLPGGPTEYVAITPIDWNAAVIHDFNQSKRLDLQPEHIPAYLDHFCQHITADEGYFKIAESGSTLDWQGSFASAADAWKRALVPIELWTPRAVDFRPPTPNGRRQGRWFLARAKLVYGGDLFCAEFAVHQAGYVEMLDDNPAIDRMPVVPERITDKTHFVYRRAAGVP